ncbi:MAG TPA: cell surface protein, partial [Myxococcota bacterium]
TVVVACAACGVDVEPVPDAGPDVDVDCDPFAVDVVSFSPGRNAGFGADALPGIVLGPPSGPEGTGGSRDVVSLGVGGSIVLELGCTVIDGDGVDVVVYENPFQILNPNPDDDPATDDAYVGAFVERAEVAVSDDGEHFATFGCVVDGSNHDDGVDGCAGMTPVVATADNGLAGVFPAGGGDGFDLATVGVERARFVRITDRASGGSGTAAGFDLDAVAVVVR